MAENMLTQAVSFINDNSTMEIGLTAEGQPAARSDIVAYHFHRNHKDVLRDIRRLRAKCPESFYRRNFAPVDYQDAKGEKRLAYLLTRDAFSLLVMGFTGAEAVLWKIRYIEAFNILEAAVLKNRAELARESGYQQGLDEGRASVAPMLEETRQDTARPFWRVGPVQKRRLRSAVRYRKMGLGIHAIAKLLDVSAWEVSRLLKAAEALGELPDRATRPIQGSLFASVTSPEQTGGAAS